MENQSLVEPVQICSVSFLAGVIWAGDLNPPAISAWDKGSLFLL